MRTPPHLQKQRCSQYRRANDPQNVREAVHHRWRIECCALIQSLEMPQPSPPPTQPLLIAPSLRRRIACWLYECLLLTGILIVFGLLLSSAGVFLERPLPPNFLQALLFLVAGFYFSLFWSYGQTVAMKTWKMKIVDRKGLRITKIRALTRYAICSTWLAAPLFLSSILEVDPIDILVLFSIWVMAFCFISKITPKKQFIHDILSGTLLVQTKENEQ